MSASSDVHPTSFVVGKECRVTRYVTSQIVYIGIRARVINGVLRIHLSLQCFFVGLYLC